MTTNQIITQSIATSAGLLHRMVDDLSPADWTRRPLPEANCVAWIIGHLATIEHSMLQTFGRTPPALPEGEFAKIYGMGSKPTADMHYGDVGRLMPLFDAHRAMTVQAITAMSADDFNRPLTHPMFKSVGEMVALIPVHTALHAGQISTIRRSLGKPALM
ncbi:MAG TPA: DinB family protein [Tepidisphaeraceae bacterium]|jgi:hypothetical protein